MFSSRVILFVLAFITVLASAAPTRRRACPVAAKPAPSASIPTAPAPINLKGSTTPHAPSPSSPPSFPPPKSTPSPPSGSPPKSAPPTGGSVSGLMGKLFPVSDISESWSTSPSSNKALALADSTFRPKNVLTSVPHSYTTAPDGKQAMKAHYPKGSFTFGHSPQGGFSFYAPGPTSVDLTTAKEATFGYSVFFPAGFSFNLGGKLPGLYGGNSEAEAVGCSGGSRSEACFSARLMWRTGGKGEFYTYLPPSFAANKAVCNVAPESDCNPTYGASVGRGSFNFASGGWTTVSERVKLNDVGQANGELQLFVNGKSVINVAGLVLRNSGAGRIRGMQMQTFFGGSHLEFASPKDQDVFFSDFSVAVTETL